MKTPIDPELLRDRLSVAQGKQYWRSLEELAEDPGFQDMLLREFPNQAYAWTDALSRRNFLTLMGASLALAGLGGCTRRPTETIMPYVRQPERMILGKPLFYATTMTLGGYGTGLLVESHEGRPTKIEGNTKHPTSLGATSVHAQAAILGLYDPDRSQTVQYRQRVRTWSDVVEELRRRLGPQSKRAKGKGLAILTETVGSPTLAWQLGAFLTDYPQAQHFLYEPWSRDSVAEGARLAFGKPTGVHYQLAGADVIVALDADLLGSLPGHLAYTHDWAARRRDAGGKAGMNRLYAVEATLTITGAVADNRLSLPPSQVEGFARALAGKLGVEAVEAPKLEGRPAAWIDVLARDLTRKDGKSRPAGTTLVVAGDGQPPAVHAVVHAINAKLGNLGKTVVLTAPVLPSIKLPKEKVPDRSSMSSLDRLRKAIEGGKIDTLLILGGNPAYTAPADIPLAELLQNKLLDRNWLAVHLGTHFDETSRLCQWHIPEAHFLESWSDARAHDGTASIVQPLIAPLYSGRSAHEVLAALSRRKNGEGGKTSSDYDERSPYQLVRDYWRAHRPERTAKEDFERFWQTTLHDGVIDGTKFPALEKPALQDGWAKRIGPPPKASGGAAGEVELIFALDPAVYDGRFANNGWLQEMPKPLTKLTWDNAVLMSPATADKLGVKWRIGAWKGGEHGDSIVSVVRLEHGEGVLEAPAWILPGHADGAVTLHLGYGRTRAGKVGTGVGVDANTVRNASHPRFLTGVRISKVDGKSHTLACTQGHFNMAGRDPARSATLAEYKKDPHFATRHDLAGGHNGKGRHELPTLYPPDHQYNGYKWGMALDLSTCTGCSACVVACQAENNIPVVGKDQVTRGREMHWLRIDRYFETRRDDKERIDQLRVHFQPVMCQHCENAPCEVVCPVEATVHGDEGTNDMVYNRCVGTRYCSNNCPYKVRRFNFLQYSDYTTPSLKLMYNPDVTVRTRGVMEKCTFCIQRIAYARIEASKEALDNPGQRADPHQRKVQGADVAYIRDGEVVTACQAACPAGAIVFGDLNDKDLKGQKRPGSAVWRMHQSELRYDLLGDLNTRPRAFYLAELHNPNPELEGK
jgi:molybdopterin-containing oxidoreductase family iron-sulfur binding subunit